MSATPIVMGKGASQPADCPKSPVTDPQPCVLELMPTHAQHIKNVERCMRCGWINPLSLDAQAEDWYKRRQAGSGAAMRTALASTGEPFTFVRGSEADISLSEAIGQALGAASMCWVGGTGNLAFDSARAAQIYKALWAVVQEKTKRRSAD